MIKIALNHWIYENCINIIFNAIGKNFSSLKKVEYNYTFFNTGDRFHSIKYKHYDYRSPFNLMDCVVLGVWKYSILIFHTSDNVPFNNDKTALLWYDGIISIK